MTPAYLLALAILWAVLKVMDLETSAAYDGQGERL